MNVQYRVAKPLEGKIIEEFQIHMAKETEEMELNALTVQKGVEWVFKNPEWGTYHICEVNGKIAGSLLILKEWSDWRCGFVWWIHSLYIAPEFRGQKLFSGFYKYIQTLTEKDSMARGLRLYVDNRNTHAQKVYKKLGMNSEHYQLFEWMK